MEVAGLIILFCMLSSLGVGVMGWVVGFVGILFGGGFLLNLKKDLYLTLAWIFLTLFALHIAGLHLTIALRAFFWNLYFGY